MPRASRQSDACRPPASVPAAERLRAKDIARLEACSPGTARALMRTGALGPVFGRNARVRWVDRRGYDRWLRSLIRRSA